MHYAIYQSFRQHFRKSYLDLKNWIKMLLETHQSSLQHFPKSFLLPSTVSLSPSPSVLHTKRNALNFQTNRRHISYTGKQI